ncbi:conjugal transfer protein TraF [Thiorhodococcus minor]|uniref:Conjugal transfer protein TraF n=1 Tax=Thiorhodococcus minor TaxID=57489 RepID=A0A6M0JVT1_9GAMM|nr:conjugal transfer protein TraF [Thiorhodococcus minor]NEV61618.1 conjugal transfer protein TraF [Thiorhodococcus minor]
MLIALLLAAQPPLATAAEPTGFYQRRAEGWFWYQRQPQLTPPRPREPEPEQAATPASPPPIAPSVSAPDLTEPAPLSAAWLRAHLEDYRLQAIDDPSPTRVALYLYLQKLALDKASRFTETFQRVVQSDPYLDETTRRPVGNYANLLNRVAGEQRDQVLQSLAREAGIWLFYRSDCPYCAAQAPVLRLLTKRQGFTIQAIALDGRPLSGGIFPDFRPDAGQARRLGVISTPALFLVRPPDGIVPLAQGLLSLTDLEQRILVAAHEAGWIDADSFARTRPLVAALSLDSPGALPAEVPEDPAAFLAVLRAHARGAIPAATPLHTDPLNLP